MTTHRVHSSKFNISAPDAAQANLVRQKIKEFAQYNLTHIFESVFDILPENQTLHIPKLEIDLGNIDIQNLENLLKIKLNEKLMETLMMLLKQYAESGVSGTAPGLSGSEISVRNGKELYVDPSGKIVAQADQGFNDPASILVHYLQQGRLPWYASDSGIEAFNQLLLELKTQYPVFIQWLNKYEPQSVEYVRITGLVRNQTWLHWLEFERPETKDFFAFFRSDFNAILPHVSHDIQKALLELEQSVLHIAKTIVLQTNPLPKIAKWADFFTLISTRFYTEFKDIVKQIKSITPGVLEAKAKNNKWVKALLEIEEIKKTKSLPKTEENNPAISTENKISTSKKPFNAPKYKQDAESFLVEDAGLVLLWPFMAQLFTHLQWFDEEKGEFTDEFSQNKACVFLHYLVYSQLPETENALVLPKIICGIDIDAPVNLDFNFQALEIETGNELLTAAAKHWTALRTESGDALRSEFFMRKGILKFTDPNWSLTIERKSIDILIDRLPWSISTIKLPWNSYILNTTW